MFVVELPFAGDVSVTVGPVVSTRHVDVAGEDAFPAASTAFTWNVWLPSARPLYPFGLVHAAKPTPSSWHWKVEPPSPAVNSKLAVPVPLGSVGPLVIVAVGAVTSIAQLKLATGPAFEAPSRALTSKVCGPSLRPE